MKTCKRVLAVLLAALLLGGILPVGASAAELTKEQSLELMDSAQRLIAIKEHRSSWLLLKSGKTAEAFGQALTGNLETQAAENGLDLEVLVRMYFAGGDADIEAIVLALYETGVLESYMNAIVTSYESAIKNHCSFLGNWLYSITKWLNVSVWPLFIRLGFKFA
jgi:hypothetical protein